MDEWDRRELEAEEKRDEGEGGEASEWANPHAKDYDLRVSTIMTSSDSPIDLKGKAQNCMARTQTQKTSHRQAIGYEVVPKSKKVQAAQ